MAVDSAAPTPAAQRTTDLRVWLALGSIYLIWGSTYLFIRLMVRTVPPMLGAGVRFTAAGLLLLGIVAVRDGIGAVRVPARSLGSAALIGVLLAAGGNGLVTLAEKHVPSGLAALLVASVPLWIVVYRTILRDRVPAATVAGVLVGMAGLAVLLLAGHRPERAPLGGCLIVIAAAASWALGTLLSPRLPTPRDPLTSTGWQILAGGIVLLAIAIPDGELPALAHASAEGWLSIAYLAVVGSIVAFSAYSWLLQHAPVSKVATYAYVNPVVAVALGWAFLGEDLPATTILGTAIIVASVATIVRTESR